MITTTLRQIQEGALDQLGVTGFGYAMTAEQAAKGLFLANRLVDSWGTQPQTMYTVTRSVTPCAAGGLEYTIGPGGDFDMARPVQLQGAGFIVPGTSGETTEELPLPVITDAMYRLNQMKRQTNSQPTMLYYNPTNTGADGLGRILLWPILTQEVSIVLYVQEFVSQFTNLTTAYTLVPALERALRFNLAKEQIAMYGRAAHPEAQFIMREAGLALADYKRGNARLVDLPSDAIFTGNRRYGYNINTGTGG